MTHQLRKQDRHGSTADKLLGSLDSDVSIPDPHCGYLPVVGENAQRARIEEKMLSGSRWQPDPSRRKHAQQVPMPKQGNVAVHSPRSRQD